MRGGLLNEGYANANGISFVIWDALGCVYKIKFKNFSPYTVVKPYTVSAQEALCEQHDSRAAR